MRTSLFLVRARFRAKERLRAPPACCKKHARSCRRKWLRSQKALTRTMPYRHYGRWRARWLDENGQPCSHTFEQHKDALYFEQKKKAEVVEIKRASARRPRRARPLRSSGGNGPRPRGGQA